MVPAVPGTGFTGSSTDSPSLYPDPLNANDEPLAPATGAPAATS